MLKQELHLISNLQCARTTLQDKKEKQDTNVVHKIYSRKDLVGNLAVSTLGIELIIEKTRKKLYYIIGGKV